jgi:ATP-dependent DNA ligase
MSTGPALLESDTRSLLALRGRSGREHELEGVVAKKLDGRYRPGEREWVKFKSRAYLRYELERESAIRVRRARRSTV